MLNRKPEFIDPEEQKFTFYYDRTKRERKIKNECCPNRRRLLVFESTKGKVGLVVVYLVLIGYIYITSGRYNKNNVTKYDDVKIKMVNYYVPDEKKVYLNLFFESRKEKNIHLESLYIKVSKDKFNLEKEIIVNEDLNINPTYSMTYDLFFRENPSEIFLVLYVRDNDKLIPINMQNKF